MTKLTITIPEVIPWKRPGLSRNKFYDAQKVDKVRYAAIAKQAMIAQNVALRSIYNPSVAISFNVTYYFKPLYKKSTEGLLNTVYVKKPDIDNLTKFIMDAFNGILYYDDCQVASLTARKIYGIETKTVIEVEEING